MPAGPKETQALVAGHQMLSATANSECVADSQPC